MKLLLINCLLLLLSYSAVAQSSSPSSKSPAPEENQTPSSMRPSDKRDRRSSYFEPSHPARTARFRRQALSPEQEFYLRMKAVAKEKRKLAKELQKPQWSDPAYFGHKRMPKRHRPDKIRYCKECGIRH